MDTGRSYSDEFLDSMRLTADADADQFIAYIFSDPDRRKYLQLWMSGNSTSEQLIQLQKEYPQYPFLADAEKLPDWADIKLMKKGAVFFAKHAEQIMTLLGLLSLPYCYAAANGAMVIYLSELMRKETGKRLYDTAVFVWEVMNPNAFEKNGRGPIETLKIRLRHAAARFYTEKSGQWDNKWGVPINQEDMAGTNLSFSLIVIRGLRKLGVNISYPDQTAFIHLWSVIGCLLGMREELIAKDIRMAQNLELSIKRRQFQTSTQGKSLTLSLTQHIAVAQSAKASSKEILGLMRYLLGDDLSGMLGIEAPALPNYKLTMLELSNLPGNFIFQTDTRQLYNRAYLNFKKQNKVM
jgi:hypothetical protein